MQDLKRQHDDVRESSDDLQLFMDENEPEEAGHVIGDIQVMILFCATYTVNTIKHISHMLILVFV